MPDALRPASEASGIFASVNATATTAPLNHNHIETWRGAYPARRRADSTASGIRMGGKVAASTLSHGNMN